MQIDELQVAIEDIPDGAHPSRRPQRTFNGAPGSKSGEITIDISKVDGRMTNADYYKHSEETQAFQSEWDEAKKRQDQQLQSIEAGLGTLKEIGGLAWGWGQVWASCGRGLLPWELRATWGAGVRQRREGVAAHELRAKGRLGAGDCTWRIAQVCLHSGTKGGAAAELHDC